MEIELKSCPKNYTYDQDKAEPPEITADRASRSLKDSEGLGTFKLEQRKSPVPGAFSFSSSTDKYSASGKGLTAEQSKASAAMEFAERYSWLHFDYKNYDGYTMKSFNEMKSNGLATVEEGYFLNNFIGLENKNALLSEIMNIPLKWIKGFSLSTKSDYYYPINWHNNIFSSNGLASGNTIEEAILQAICELIERENVYRLFVLKMPGKYVDPGSINHPLIKKTFAESASQGIDFLIKDISSELAVPTFVVRGTKENDRGKLTYQGCGQGASPAPIKALIRSIAEYFEGFLIMASSQDRMKFEAGAYIGSMPKKHLGFITLLNPEILEESRGRESFSDIPDMSMNDIKDEIEWIIDLLHKLGHEVVVINKTLPQLRIPVVRVFIPMMRSCINTEILRPESLVAQAYFEAGDTVSANKYIRESISKDPVLRNLSPFLSNVPAELFFKKDYIESMLAFNAFKKNGIDFLNKFSGSIPGILQGKKLS